MNSMVICPKCGHDFLDQLNCTRCGHKWKPRNSEKPKVCPNPKCKSPYWDRLRIRKIKNKQGKK